MTKLNCRPLADRLLIERIAAEETTAGGIIIPDNAKEKPKQGKVLAVGPGARDDHGNRIRMDVKAGDTIVFTQWSGIEIEIGRKKLLVMKESDIIAVVE